MSYKDRPLYKAGDNISKAGSTMFRRITLPIILFFIGALTFPIGILFWLLALVLMFGKSK